MSKIVKIVNYKEDPKREGHTLSVESVSQIKRNPTKSKAVLKKPSTRDLLIGFIDKQEKFNEKILSKVDNLENRFNSFEKDVSHIVKVNKLVR